MTTTKVACLLLRLSELMTDFPTIAPWHQIIPLKAEIMGHFSYCLTIMNFKGSPRTFGKLCKIFTHFEHPRINSTTSSQSLHRFSSLESTFSRSESLTLSYVPSCILSIHNPRQSVEAVASQ